MWRSVLDGCKFSFVYLKIYDWNFDFCAIKRTQKINVFGILEYSWTSECIQFHFSFCLWISFFFYHHAKMQIFNSSPRASKRPLSLCLTTKCINFWLLFWNDHHLVLFSVDKQWTKMWIACHESAKVERKNEIRGHTANDLVWSCFPCIFILSMEDLFVILVLYIFFLFSKILFLLSFFLTVKHDISNNLKPYS